MWVNIQHACKVLLSHSMLFAYDVVHFTVCCVNMYWCIVCHNLQLYDQFNLLYLEQCHMCLNFFYAILTSIMFKMAHAIFQNQTAIDFPK